MLAPGRDPLAVEFNLLRSQRDASVCLLEKVKGVKVNHCTLWQSNLWQWKITKIR